MRGSHTRPVRATLTVGLFALVTTIGLGGSVLAQSPTPTGDPDAPAVAPGADLFPSAVEISEILGGELELLGVDRGLSQAWEGSDFAPETVRSIQMAMYRSPEAVDEGQLKAVIIDVVRFEGADEALSQARELMFGEDPVPTDFESGLTGDLAITTSFTHEGLGGTFVFVVSGPDAFSVSAMAMNEEPPETAGEAIAQLIQDRLASEP